MEIEIVLVTCITTHVVKCLSNVSDKIGRKKYLELWGKKL